MEPDKKAQVVQSLAPVTFSRKGGGWLAPCGLGVSIFAMLFLLMGCGSGSKPGAAGTGAAKQPVAANSKAAKMPVMSLLNAQPGAMKEPQMTYNAEGQAVFAGLTKEQMEAKVAEQLKNFEPKGKEVYPGVSLEQMEAKIAAEQKKVEAVRQSEIFPGVTVEQMESKVAAGLREGGAKRLEVFPGVTAEQMNAKLAQQQPVPREKGDLTPPSGAK